MFDASFARSEVYLQTLEFLRIFQDSIQQTGQRLRELDLHVYQPWRRVVVLPRNAWSRGPYMFIETDPSKDGVSLKNWAILMEYYCQAESRLLHIIDFKMEEIRNLRDGVRQSCPLCPLLMNSDNEAQLLNASSLREASRSTMLNRYSLYDHGNALSPSQLYCGMSFLEGHFVPSSPKISCNLASGKSVG